MDVTCGPHLVFSMTHENYMFQTYILIRLNILNKMIIFFIFVDSFLRFSALELFPSHPFVLIYWTLWMNVMLSDAKNAIKMWFQSSQLGQTHLPPNPKSPTCPSYTKIIPPMGALRTITIFNDSIFANSCNRNTMPMAITGTAFRPPYICEICEMTGCYTESRVQRSS